MHPRTALIPLALALAWTLAAAPAEAQVPRKKARVTEETEESDLPVTKKKKRKHASSIEEDLPVAPLDDSPPPTARKKGKAAPASDLPPPRKERVTSSEDEETPAPPRSSGVRADPSDEPAPRPRPADDPPPRRSSRTDDDEEVGTRRSGKDDDAELRDEADHGAVRRSSRTAEEDLADADAEDESLAAADEPGHALAVELLLGAYFLHSPLPGVETRFTMGLDVSWGMGRYLFEPEWEFFHQNLFLEAGYLATKSTLGTEAVQVTSWYHTLWLSVLFGYPLEPVFVYGKIGPAMTVTPVTYDVQGGLTSFSGVKGGVVYGVGVRTNLYVTDQVGVAAKLELVRFRRGYLDDTVLAMGLGAAF